MEKVKKATKYIRNVLLGFIPMTILWVIIGGGFVPALTFLMGFKIIRILLEAVLWALLIMFGVTLTVPIALMGSDFYSLLERVYNKHFD